MTLVLDAVRDAVAVSVGERGVGAEYGLERVREEIVVRVLGREWGDRRAEIEFSRQLRDRYRGERESPVASPNPCENRKNASALRLLDDPHR